jgi:hypothetical protein
MKDKDYDRDNGNGNDSYNDNDNDIDMDIENDNKENDNKENDCSFGLVKFNKLGTPVRQTSLEDVTDICQNNMLKIRETLWLNKSANVSMFSQLSSFFGNLRITLIIMIIYLCFDIAGGYALPRLGPRDQDKYEGREDIQPHHVPALP